MLSDFTMVLFGELKTYSAPVICVVNYSLGVRLSYLWISILCTLILDGKKDPGSLHIWDPYGDQSVTTVFINKSKLNFFLHFFLNLNTLSIDAPCFSRYIFFFREWTFQCTGRILLLRQPLKWLT